MISIVIPCYNEEESVRKVYKNFSANLGKSGKRYEIIFVDDGSKDSTSTVLEKIRNNDRNVRIVKHEKNMGLGKALRTGFVNAKGDAIITADADSEHDACYVPMMANLIYNGYDVVVGSRFSGGGYTGNVPAYRVLLSKFTTTALHLIFGMWGVNDMTSGYRAYSKKVKEINVTTRGFQSEMEILYKMNRSGARITEVPIVAKRRTGGRSKFKFFKTAAEYLRLVWNLKFGPGGG